MEDVIVDEKPFHGETNESSQLCSTYFMIRGGKHLQVLMTKVSNMVTLLFNEKGLLSEANT